MSEKICSFDGCGRKNYCKGLCKAHYNQQWEGKELTTHKNDRPKSCVFDSCGRPVVGNDLCRGHYHQQRNGKELTTLRSDLPKVCSFDGCGRKIYGKGLCKAHHQQQFLGKELTTLRQDMPKKVCSFEGCGRKHQAGGLCSAHYSQRLAGIELQKHRSDVTVEERFLSNVDKTETCWIWTGSCDSSGYGSIGVNGKYKSAHRLAYELFVGPIPTGETVHHKCAVAKCTNPDHLELATLRANVGEMHARRAYKARIAELEAEVKDLRRLVRKLQASALSKA